MQCPLANELFFRLDSSRWMITKQTGKLCCSQFRYCEAMSAQAILHLENAWGTRALKATDRVCLLSDSLGIQSSSKSLHAGSMFPRHTWIHSVCMRAAAAHANVCVCVLRWMFGSSHSCMPVALWTSLNKLALPNASDAPTRRYKQFSACQDCA